MTPYSSHSSFRTLEISRILYHSVMLCYETRVTIRPHFQELYYRPGGIFKIDANVRKLDLSILIFTFERRQERRKYCNRKNFVFDYLWICILLL